MLAEWIKLATLTSGLDADIARATLEEADILGQVRGHQVRVFGGWGWIAVRIRLVENQSRELTANYAASWEPS